MHGRVRVDAWCREDGRHLWTRESLNLVVLTATSTVARLLRDPANNTGYQLAAIGLGTGAGTPAITDTGLGGSQAYYRPLDSVTLPVVQAGQPAQVQAAWSLNGNTPKDYAATGLEIKEIGLFCNPGSVALPAAVGLGLNPPQLIGWVSGSYNVGARIIDGYGRIQRCTTSGATGVSEPTWNQVVGGTTADGSAQWTCIADNVAPSVMFARALLGLGEVTDNVAFSSTWTITL